MFTGREFSKDGESAYWAYVNYYHIEHTPEKQAAFNRGWYLGAQYAMRTSAELSPHIARFLEWVMWLTEGETPSDEQ